MRRNTVILILIMFLAPFVSISSSPKFSGEDFVVEENLKEVEQDIETDDSPIVSIENENGEKEKKVEAESEDNSVYEEMANSQKKTDEIKPTFNQRERFEKEKVREHNRLKAKSKDGSEKFPLMKVYKNPDLNKVAKRAIVSETHTVDGTTIVDSFTIDEETGVPIWQTEAINPQTKVTIITKEALTNDKPTTVIVKGPEGTSDLGRVAAYALQLSDKTLPKINLQISDDTKKSKTDLAFESRDENTGGIAGQFNIYEEPIVYYTSYGGGGGSTPITPSAAPSTSPSTMPDMSSLMGGSGMDMSSLSQMGGGGGAQSGSLSSVRAEEYANGGR